MTEQKNRVVVTGLGLITSIGNSVPECWDNAINGVSGIRHTNTVETENCYSSLAAEVDCDTLAEVSDIGNIDRVAMLCIKASVEATKDAGLTDFGGSTRAFVIMGSCVGGVNSAEHYYKNDKMKSDINKIGIAPIANHVEKHFNVGGCDEYCQRLCRWNNQHCLCLRPHTFGQSRCGHCRWSGCLCFNSICRFLIIAST